MDGFGGIIP